MKNIIYTLIGVLVLYSSSGFSYLYETDTSLDPHESQMKKFSELLPGEKIDLHTGEVGHYLETVNIKGNGLPIRLGHRFHGELGYDVDVGRMSLEVPRIEFIHMGEPDYLGWNTRGEYVVLTPYKTNIRCSELTLPSDAEYRSPQYENPEPIPQDPNTILRSGIKIKLGYETVDFFPKAHDPSNRFPSSAVYISPSNWYIECVNSINVTGKNAFKAVSPDGITYIFDIYQEAGVHEPLLPDYPALKNTEAKVYVSSVTDKHGNWLKYEYDRYDAIESQVIDAINSWSLRYYRSRISSITSKDGRKIDISYAADSVSVQSNSSNPVKLIYTSSSSNDRLRITRKDGKYWEFNYGNSYNPYRNGKVIESIHYPNGLNVSYEYKTRNRGEYLAGNLPAGVLANLKSAITKRVVSGPEMSPLTENYTYSGNTTFVKSDVGSIEYKFVKIDYQKDPLNTPVAVGKLIAKKIFPRGTDFNQRGSVSPLKQFDYAYSRIGNVIDLTYLKNNWYIQYGASYERLPVEVMTSTHASFLTEPTSISVRVDGYTFITRKSNYDIWGKPRTIVETNTLGKSRTTTKTYHYDTTNWIVGKLASEYINEASPVVTTFDYYPTGKVKEKVKYSNSGNEITEHYVYHSDGNLYQILMFKGGSLIPKKTLWDYYRGIARWQKDGAGNLKRTEVFDYGKIKSETDFNGHQPTTFQYDVMHRVVRVSPPIGSATVVSWPTLTRKITTKGAYRQVVDYNAYMKPVLVTEQDTSRGESRYFRKRYDSAGRLIFEAVPSSNSNESVGKEIAYDALNRIVSIRHTGDNGVTTYCHGSSCGLNTKYGVLETDPRGYKHVWNYLSFGDPNERKVEEIRQQKALFSNNFVVTRINRGLHLEIKSIVQGGVERKYNYKPRTLLLDSKIEPEIGVVRYLAYDERGNLLQKKVGNSGVTYFTYDADDKIVKIDYPGATEDIKYQYINQNIKKIITGNNSTVWVYTYDALNKIKSESLTIDGLIFNVSYSYDNLGNIDFMRLPRIEAPFSSRVVDVTVDALGRTRSIYGFVSSIEYFPNDVISSMYYGNGYSYIATLNAKHQPRNIYTAGIVRMDLVDLTYTYDKSDNVISITDALLTNNNRSMGYDGLGRLISANGRWGVGVISYSDSNNIKSMKLGGASWTYNYDGSQRLRNITGSLSKQFSYDVYGNIINNGRDSFVYNDANQMMSVNNQNIHYTYDGNKKRVKVKTPGKTVYYIYNKAGDLLYRYDATSNKDVEYINLNGKLLAKLENGPSIAATKIIDSDNDGLSDADELAWGTNLNNPDTDGDTISDGDEVAQGRNPLVVETPPAPTGLSAPVSSNGSFVVKWDGAPTATSYVLQQKTTGNWVTIYSGSGLNKSRTGLYPAAYYYRVKSCNSGGCSNYSSTVKTQVVKKISCKYPWCNGVQK